MSAAHDPALPELELLRSYRDEDELLERYLRKAAQGKAKLEILEAGCGQRWLLDLTGIEHTLTGVDLDEAALSYRKTVSKDLDEAIVGDLRDLQLGAGGFDVIYNSFVLEHIENAERVLENFSRWLRPGGLIAIENDAAAAGRHRGGRGGVVEGIGGHHGRRGYFR